MCSLVSQDTTLLTWNWNVHIKPSKGYNAIGVGFDYQGNSEIGSSSLLFLLPSL